MEIDDVVYTLLASVVRVNLPYRVRGEARRTNLVFTENPELGKVSTPTPTPGTPIFPDANTTPTPSVPTFVGTPSHMIGVSTFQTAASSAPLIPQSSFFREGSKNYLTYTR